tara:strand:+ start:958 stop:1416 length:459 start_codon:yes stop_codon:yes gene_type:complete
MPELPDVTVYVERLRARVVGQPLDRVRLDSPFVLRSVTPPLSSVETQTVRAVSRLGKRIVITLDGHLSLVIHLMIAELATHDRGGLELLDATVEQFREALTRENHTAKRALIDPRLFSGIGNAYSDEILHASRLSPMKLTQKLSEDEIVRLY